MKKIIMLILVTILMISLYQMSLFYINRKAENDTEETVTDIIEQYSEPAGESEEDSVFTHEAFEELKKINSCFIGYLYSEDFIREPVVADDADSSDDYYLDHWIDGSYNSQGTVYTKQNADSKNIVLYGHCVMYDSTKRFTPYADMYADQEKFLKHRKITVWFETEKREYEIAAVAAYHIYDDAPSLDVEQNDFSEDEFEQYREWFTGHNSIESETYLEYEDRWITLVTCSRWRENERILILCRETYREEYR